MEEYEEILVATGMSSWFSHVLLAEGAASPAESDALSFAALELFWIAVFVNTKQRCNFHCPQEGKSYFSKIS